MSELKAFDVGLGRYTEDGYPCVVAFDADQNPRLLGDEKVYLKAEADKVIAEKDAEIARLKAIRKVHVEAIESMGAGLLQDEEENRHQKYKRCLAMADYAEAASCYHATLANGFWLLRNDLKKRDDERRIAKRWDKWQNRWLALADEFKEAKL